MKLLKSPSPNFASSKLDCFCVTIFVFGVHLALWYEVCLVLPHYNFKEASTVNTHLTMAAIFYFGVLSNLYKLITTRTDCNLGVLGSNETREWPFCDRCCIYKPPRSHHCKRCNVCILLRDHHCWFAGCCIGYSNYRYYLSLLLYIFSAAIYANVFHFQFVLDRLGGLGELLPVCVVAPHFGALVTGLASRNHFSVNMMTSLTLYSAVLFGWLWKIQLHQLLFGQTKYEHTKQIKDYNIGIISNLTTLMGRCWYIAWICPWIPSPLPGDGMTFPTRVKTK